MGNMETYKFITNEDGSLMEKEAGESVSGDELLEVLGQLAADHAERVRDRKLFLENLNGDSL